jgi:uncharacterized membrane protein YecN with MAPEG domain
MHITLLYAGLLALWFLVLSFKVIKGRGKGGVNLGDGGKPDMLRVIRGHANFAEYVPFILLMMAMLESSGVSPWLLHVIGATLLVSRILHGIALSFTEKFFFGRFVGTAATLLVLGVCALLGLWIGLGLTKF